MTTKNKNKYNNVVRINVWSEKGSLITSVTSKAPLSDTLDVLKRMLHEEYLRKDTEGRQNMDAYAPAIICELRCQDDSISFSTGGISAHSASIDIYNVHNTDKFAVSITEFDSIGNAKTLPQLKLYDDVLQHDAGDIVEFAYQPTTRSESKWRKIELVDSDEMHINGYDLNDNRTYKSFLIEKIIGGLDKVFKEK